jgi:hypothetical protein
MKHTRILLLPFIFICIIVGCSADRSDPVQPTDRPMLEKLAGTSLDTAVSWSGSLIADPCNGEVLSCIGSMEFRIRMIPKASDGWHITSHMMSENFVATNQKTGTTYRVNESSIYSAEVRPPYPVVSTQTIMVNMKGSDGSHFRLHCHLHVTIDMTGHLHLSGGDASGVCS